SRLRRFAVMVSALSLTAGTLAVGAATPAATASTVIPTTGYQPSPSDYYINYAPPRVQSDTTLVNERVPQDGARRTAALARAIDRKYASGNPVAARVLAKHERQALRTGKNPFDFIYKKSKTTKTARLLTILVEFNDE